MAAILAGICPHDKFVIAPEVWGNDTGGRTKRIDFVVSTVYTSRDGTFEYGEIIPRLMVESKNHTAIS